MPWNAKSLLFGGVDEIVLVGNVLVYGTPDRFSISAWIKTTNVAGQTIVAKQGAGTPYGWQLALDSNGRVFFEMIYVYPGTMLLVRSSLAVNDGAWHHVVVTWNGNASPGYTGAKLYIDGALQTLSGFTDTLGTNNVASTASLAIGCRNTGSDTMPFVGNIDEVSVHSKVLTASEVTWVHNSGRPRDLLVLGAPSNLVGWWRMGDGDVFPVVSDHSPTFVHPTVKDSSGGGYTGTMTNMESTDAVLDVPGRNLFSSGSVLFGGTDEYATMGDVLSFERTQAFSISLWFKTASVTGGILLTKMVGASTYRGYQVSVNSGGTLTFALRSDNSTGNAVIVSTTVGWNDGTWHHVVCTYSGSSTAAGCKIYVDGASVSLATTADALTATIVDTGALTLGMRVPDSASPYVGGLDEVAVHNKELSAAEVIWIYNNGLPRDLYASGAPFNLVAWWRMGDGDIFSTLRDYGPGAVFPTVRDLSGSNYTGTMTNMEVTDIVSDVPGKSAYSMKSVRFEGTDEYVTMGDVFAFERTDPFSVSLWFKTANASVQHLFTKMEASPRYRGYQHYISATGVIYAGLVSDWAVTNCMQVFTASSGWNDGKWHHLVRTYDGSSTAAGCKIYLDGVSQPLTVHYAALSATVVCTNALWAGSSASGSPLVGSLDEVAVYSDVLSDSEVAWIYNSGTPRALTDSGCPSNLAAWWRMGEGDTFPTLLDSGPGGWVNPYPTMTDYSGSGFTGTMANMESTDIIVDAPTAPTGTHSTAFEGTNEYVNMGNVLGFERTDPFTFAFWVKYTSTGQMTVLSKMYADGSFTGYEVMLMNGQITLWLLSNYGSGNYFRVDTVGTFNDGAWHHIVVTYTGSSVAAGVKIYVDNVERGTTVSVDSLTASILTSVPFNLGIRNLGTGSYTGPLVGRLNNVGIWNRVLSSDDRVAVYGGLPSAASSGLIGWWRMGEGSIGPLNGLMTNMESTDIVTDSPFQGAFARRPLRFEGTNEYVTMGNVLDFARTSPFSVSFWLRVTTPGTYYVISKIQLSGPTGWVCYTSAAGTIDFTMAAANPGPNIDVYVSGTTVEDGSWHHVVVTWNGDTSPGAAGVKIYLDGVSQTLTINSNTLGSNSINNSGSFVLGSTTWGGLPLIGLLDEAAVYSKTLSAADVTWIYNGGVPRDLKGIGAPWCLAGWWRLGESAYPGTMTNMESTDLAAEAPVPTTFATKSLAFDGVDEYVTMGNVLSFERTDPFSFSYWLRFTGSTVRGYQLSKFGVGTAYRGYNVSMGVFTLNSNDATANWLRVGYAGDNLRDGQWHHLVWAYSGSSLASGVRLFVDGVEVTPLTVVADALTATIVNTDPFRLGTGGTAATGWFWEGRLDEVAVYNRALSPQEAVWIYNGGVPRDLQAPTAPTNLVAWWRLGEAGLPGTMTYMESPDIVSDALGTDESQQLAVPTVAASTTGGGEGSDGTTIPMTIPVNPTRYYKMRARDSGAAPPGYVTWVAEGDPDFAGLGYSGGIPTPIGAMVVGSVVLADEWR